MFVIVTVIVYNTYSDIVSLVSNIFICSGLDDNLTQMLLYEVL